jgi:acyl-CoA synthetase (AMP-forming)/AMP-acid ligase II
MHLSQLENVFESIDGVKGTCVVDVVQGDILAVLVTKLPNSNITEESLRKFADEKLSKFKFTGGIHIVDEIPRTNSVGNKVLRSDAKKLALKLINLKKLQVFARNHKAFESKAV